MHTTNYYNTLIELSEDSTTTCSIDLKSDSPTTVADLQFQILSQHPYSFTSDEVLFEVFALRNDVVLSEREQAWNTFFSKGQPCFRASPLPKKFGWGIHHNEEGKVALIAVESKKYDQLRADLFVKKVKAMRSKKAIK